MGMTVLGIKVVNDHKTATSKVGSNIAGGGKSEYKVEMFNMGEINFLIRIRRNNV